MTSPSPPPPIVERLENGVFLSHAPFSLSFFLLAINRLQFWLCVASRRGLRRGRPGGGAAVAARSGDSSASAVGKPPNGVWRSGKGDHGPVNSEKDLDYDDDDSDGDYDEE